MKKILHVDGQIVTRGGVRDPSEHGRAAVVVSPIYLLVRRSFKTRRVHSLPLSSLPIVQLPSSFEHLPPAFIVFFFFKNSNMANLKRSASEREDEKEVLSPKTSPKRSKSTIDKASPRKASPTKKPTDGTSRSPTKALNKDWSFEEGEASDGLSRKENSPEAARLNAACAPHRALHHSQGVWRQAANTEQPGR